jgi:hypothetical protein
LLLAWRRVVVVGVLDKVVGVLAFRYLRVVSQLALSMKPALFLVTLLMACLLFE